MGTVPLHALKSISPENIKQCSELWHCFFITLVTVLLLVVNKCWKLWHCYVTTALLVLLRAWCWC